MTQKKRAGGLGRGLSALLEEVRLTPANTPEADIAAVPGGGTQLPLSMLIANPRQPRRRFDDKALEELTSSIRERGLLQPILVRPRDDGRYEIVAGERRWRAAQAARLHEVPVVIRELDDSSAFEIALIENIQRADLNAIEEAAGYRRLIEEYGHTQDELSRLVGKSRSHVANLLRLLDLPQSVRDMVIDGSLSMGHARALIGSEQAEALARRVVSEGLSVRAIEKLVMDTPGKAARPARGGASAGNSQDADIKAIEQQLERLLGLKVAIDFNRDGSGAMTLQYSSLDQLDLLCNRLTGGGF